MYIEGPDTVNIIGDLIIYLSILQTRARQLANQPTAAITAALSAVAQLRATCPTG